MINNKDCKTDGKFGVSLQENQKRSVWFKKQKYHCIYEYPREPSDTESANNSPQKHFAYGLDSSDVSNKYFTYGINSKNLTNKYFTYGLSDLIDYSNYVDWKSHDRAEPYGMPDDCASDSVDKVVGSTSGSDDRNFYNLNYFDYDFNNGAYILFLSIPDDVSYSPDSQVLKKLCETFT